MMKRIAGLPLLAIFWLICVGSATAEETFVAELIAVEGTGSAATGTATLSLDDFESEISYVIEYSGLSGPEVGAHIHRQDGTIVFELPPGEAKAGVWQNPGVVNVFLLRSEQLFILVHTEAHPGGELRGDIRAEAVGLRQDAWSAVKSSFDVRPGQP